MGEGPLDLDGTLTDSKVGITRSVQYALRCAGVDAADLATLTPYIGPQLQDSFVNLAGLSQADAIRAVASYRGVYFAETGIFEDVVYPRDPGVLGGAAGQRVAVGRRHLEADGLRRAHPRPLLTAHPL